jgi:hypothetical protein
MKFLRNPFVSGALALVAVLVVVYQIGKPLAQRYWARNVRTPAVATVTRALESAVKKATTGQPAMGDSTVSILAGASRDPIDTTAIAENPESGLKHLHEIRSGCFRPWSPAATQMRYVPG